MAENDICICNFKNCIEHIQAILKEISSQFSIKHTRVFLSFITRLYVNKILRSLDKRAVLIGEASLSIMDLKEETGLKEGDIVCILKELHASDYVFVDEFDLEDMSEPFTVSFVCNEKTIEFE